MTQKINIVSLQEGKVAIPIISSSVGNKVIVIPTQVGQRVATCLRTPTIGEMVCVMPLDGGGKVAIPLDSKYFTRYISVLYGLVPAGQLIIVGYYFKCSWYELGPHIIHRFSWPENGGGSYVANFYATLTPSWTARYPVASSVGFDRTITLTIFTDDIPIGDYYRIDYVRRMQPTTTNLPDGSFESGAFGDGITGWKNENVIIPSDTGCKARIIDSDAYDGTHSLEFYN
jgi:hypothetical protein